MTLCFLRHCGIFQGPSCTMVRLLIQFIVWRCCFFTLQVATWEGTEAVCTMSLLVGMLEVFHWFVVVIMAVIVEWCFTQVSKFIVELFEKWVEWRMLYSSRTIKFEFEGQWCEEILIRISKMKTKSKTKEVHKFCVCLAGRRHEPGCETIVGPVRHSSDRSCFTSEWLSGLF